MCRRFLLSTARKLAGDIVLWGVVYCLFVGSTSACEPVAVFERDWDAREILEVAFSPDGTRVAAADEGGTFTVWNIEDRSEVARVSPGIGGLWCVAFSPDGETVAVGGRNGGVVLWSIDDNKKLAELPAHRDTVLSVAYCPKKDRFVSAGLDKTMKAWDWETNTLTDLTTVDLKGTFVRRVSFSSGGRLLLGTTLTGALVWTTDSLAEAPWEYNGLRRGTCGAISPDEKSVVVGGMLNELHVVSLADGSLIHKVDIVREDEKGSVGMEGFLDPIDVADVAYSPNGDFIAVGGRECWTSFLGPTIWQKLVLVSVGGEWRQTKVIESKLGIVSSVCFSPDGTKLAAAGGRSVRIWAVGSNDLK